MESCPVCTLFLREGISLRDHLLTHPKEQVIEALLRAHSTTAPTVSQSPVQTAAALAVQTVSYQQIIPNTQYIAIANDNCYVPTMFNPLFNPYIPQPYPLVWTNPERPKSGSSDDMELSSVRSERESSGTCSPIPRSLPSSLSTSLSAPPSPEQPPTVIVPTPTSSNAQNLDNRCEGPFIEKIEILDKDDKSFFDRKPLPSPLIVPSSPSSIPCPPLTPLPSPPILSAPLTVELVNDPELDQASPETVTYTDLSTNAVSDRNFMELGSIRLFFAEEQSVIQMGKQERQEDDEKGGLLSIVADESMPARGELSEQESLGIDSPWDMFQRDIKPLPSSSSSANNSLTTVDKKPFKCPGCPMVFACPKERRVHANKEHGGDKQRMFGCPQCGVDFQSLRERRLHLAEAHFVKLEPGTSASEGHNYQRRCPLCENYFLTTKELRMHLRERHNMPRFKCDTCLQGFDDEASYNSHLVWHPLKCPECDKTFVRRTSLNLHRKRHLKVKPFACTICPKSFITRQKLEEHLNGHSGIKPIKCLLCDRSFTRHSNLIQHRNIHHRPGKRKVRDYVCRCGEIFHSLRKLAWHREVHDPKPKSCPYCVQKFIHAASVTRHVRRSHNPEYLPPPLADSKPALLPAVSMLTNSQETKPPRSQGENVQCPVCEKLYLKTSLAVHMRVHNGERPFACVICNKRFSTKWNMESHMWTHQARSNLPFKCNQCKSAFYRESDFKSHLNSHKNLKPYVCNICGQRFVRKYNCFRHQEEHKQIKKFACSVAGCGRTFYRSYYLKDHMKVHTGVRPHTCHICGKTSSTKSNHNKHVRIHDTREPINTEN